MESEELIQLREQLRECHILLSFAQVPTHDFDLEKNRVALSLLDRIKETLSRETVKRYEMARQIHITAGGIR